MKKSRITFVLTIITILLMLISLFFLPKLETDPNYPLDPKPLTDRALTSVALAILIIIFTGAFIGCSIYVWKEKLSEAKGRRRTPLLNACFDIGVSFFIILFFIIFMRPEFPISKKDFVLLTLVILGATFAIIGGIIYHFI